MTGSFYFPLILPNIGRIINMQAEIDIFVVLGHRWLGGALSHVRRGDTLLIAYKSFRGNTNERRIRHDRNFGTNFWQNNK